MISTYMLSKVKDRKAWVEVVQDDSAKDGYRFEVKTGQISKEEEKKKNTGVKAGKAQGFFCVLTGAPIPLSYIREQGQRQRLGMRLVAVFVQSKKKRFYLSPTREQEAAAEMDKPELLELDAEIPRDPRAITTHNYGITRWYDFFTARHITALKAFSDLIEEVREQVLHDARSTYQLDDNRSLADGGIGTNAYADAVTMYLGLLMNKMTCRNSVLCSWVNSRQSIGSTFARPALPMVWDFAEANPLSGATGSFENGIEQGIRVIKRLNLAAQGSCYQADASKGVYPARSTLISTDPPYYDNIGYADLSDFFYVWLRRSLQSVWPQLFRRVLVPKEPELVAAAYRHKNKRAAEQFFMAGMSDALKSMREAAVGYAPISIYYAFKQAEVGEEGVTSAGWASFLQAVINAGFIVDGTWPVRTELATRPRAIDSNALGSSIVLVCIKRPKDAPTTTRRDFIHQLKKEMAVAIKILQDTKVHPVDMAQASIGPGIGVFSRYAKVLNDDDSEMTVRDAIARINEIRNQILNEEDTEYDTQTQFCINWFQSFGMKQGAAATAITMAQAYNLGLEDLENANVFLSKKGKARLISREDMPRDWSPDAINILTQWECTQHLIRVLQAEDGSAKAAGELLAKMGEKGDIVLKLAHRLYHICERQNWAQEALSYNQLAQEFSSIEEYASQDQNNQQLEQKELLE